MAYYKSVVYPIKRADPPSIQPWSILQLNYAIRMWNRNGGHFNEKIYYQFLHKRFEAEKMDLKKSNK